jgi:hypothetical protein
MTEPSTQNDRQAISTMLQFDENRLHRWSTRDLRDMLLHQLAAPLHLGLGPVAEDVSRQLRAGLEPMDLRMTLGDLLMHPKPPIELLKLVKQFAKLCRRNPNHPLPSEIVMFLYYASIAVALLKTTEPISELSDPSIRRGLFWLSVQLWMPDEMKSLLNEGLLLLSTRGSSTSPESDK